MLAKPIKNLLCCLGIASVTFASCKKNDNNSGMQFSEGAYAGRVISSSVQNGNKIQTVLPANISFAAGTYSMNNIPIDELPYVDFIPYTGTYGLQPGNTAITLAFISLHMPPMVLAPGFVNGQFTIAYQADSLILTQNLPDGLSGYQYRLKKVAR